MDDLNGLNTGGGLLIPIVDPTRTGCLEIVRGSIRYFFAQLIYDLMVLPFLTVCLWIYRGIYFVLVMTAIIFLGAAYVNAGAGFFEAIGAGAHAVYYVYYANWRSHKATNDPVLIAASQKVAQLTTTLRQHIGEGTVRQLSMTTAAAQWANAEVERRRSEWEMDRSVMGTSEEEHRRRQAVLNEADNAYLRDHGYAQMIQSDREVQAKERAALRDAEDKKDQIWDRLAYNYAPDKAITDRKRFREDRRKDAEDGEAKMRDREADWALRSIRGQLWQLRDKMSAEERGTTDWQAIYQRLRDEHEQAAGVKAWPLSDVDLDFLMRGDQKPFVLKPPVIRPQALPRCLSRPSGCQD